MCPTFMFSLVRPRKEFSPTTMFIPVITHTKLTNSIYSNVPGPWWLGHPPFRHCDTPTRTIWHCNDSSHKCLHIETIRPHRGRTVQPPPNRCVWHLRSGSKHWLWQSDPFSAPPGGGVGYSSDHNTQMALLKHAAAPPMSWSAGCKTDLT